MFGHDALPVLNKRLILELRWADLLEVIAAICRTG
jgi:hypothetical protein